MDENRAAATGHPGPYVMVDFNEEVIEAVVTPEPVAWFIGRPHHRVVIVSISGILAPGGSTANTAGRQRAGRMAQSVRPPPQSQRTKPPARRPAGFPPPLPLYAPPGP